MLEQDTKSFLSESKFYEGYSRFIDDKGRYETWNEAVERVMNMHRQFYKDKLSPELETYIQRAQEAYTNKKVLGAQRALQFGGEQLLKHMGRMYNCTSSYADRAAFFGECFYWLLCGAGTGFSVQRRHVDKLPRVMPRPKQAKTYVIQDSIEGWADALDVLLSSFFEDGGKHSEYQGRKVYFEYSKIRAKGAIISGGFKAPGPEPLRAALNKIENILISASEQRRQLRPIEVYDIVMHSADAVISGGVRRSATICLFDLNDKEMANAKTGNWFVENPQRGRSNNSAVLVRGEVTKEQFFELMKSVKEFGEPGFYWVDDPDILTNPCVEIGMYPQYEGESGWQACNLSEINGASIDTLEDFFYACESAAILGTLQAGYTDFKFLTDVSKKIIDREALIGVSVTGWMNSPNVLLNAENLKKGAALVKKVNKEVAALLGINPAARTTCCKPAGNACVGIDTEVKTESGIMNMSDIFTHVTNGKMHLENVGQDTWIDVINPIKVYDENNDLQEVTKFYVNGVVDTYNIEFEDGKEYSFTGNHRLKTANGWKFVRDLTVNDEIISF